jgi:hypothetical protein
MRKYVHADLRTLPTDTREVAYPKSHGTRDQMYVCEVYDIDTCLRTYLRIFLLRTFEAKSLEDPTPLLANPNNLEHFLALCMCT